MPHARVKGSLRSGDALRGHRFPLRGLQRHIQNGPNALFVVDYEIVTNNVYAGLAYGKPLNNQAFGLTLEGNQNDLTIQAWGPNDKATDVDGVIDPASGAQRGFISHAVVLEASSSGSMTERISAGSVPARVVTPASIPSGRSVRSRSTTTGTECQGVFLWQHSRCTAWEYCISGRMDSAKQ